MGSDSGTQLTAARDSLSDLVTSARRCFPYQPNGPTLWAARRPVYVKCTVGNLQQMGVPIVFYQIKKK